MQTGLLWVGDGPSIQDTYSDCRNERLRGQSSNRGAERCQGRCSCTQMGGAGGDSFLLYPLPTAPDPTVNGNHTITTPGPGSYSSGALVSWRYMWEDYGRDVTQEAHV